MPRILLLSVYVSSFNLSTFSKRLLCQVCTKDLARFYVSNLDMSTGQCIVFGHSVFVTRWYSIGTLHAKQNQRMKIYRVSYSGLDAEHTGYSYHSTKREALQRVEKTREHGEAEMDVIHVRCSKTGVIHALNVYGGHPDNG